MVVKKRGILLTKRKLIIIGVVAVAVIFFARGAYVSHQEKVKQEEADKLTEQRMQELQESTTEISDVLLLQIQDELVSTYGKVPEGYVWDIDGTLLSLGDTDKTPEEVVYAYLTGIRTLDLSTVQKYSRNSSVIESYEGYFNDSNKNTDYTDAFKRNMYKESMLSIEVEGIESSTIFAENKQVFTVKAKMLDLTRKDFWLDDKTELYSNIKLYDSDESDSTKADMYLYDYILGYYKSDEAPMRELTFDLTLQRYPDLDTGWLVSVDTDVDSACRYADGKLVVSYIYDMYRDEGKEYLLNLESSESEDVDEEVEP